MESRSVSALFSFKPLRWRDARAVGAWHYEPPYAIYDLGHFYMLSAVLLRPLLSPLGFEMYGVWSEEGQLVGLFTFTKLGNVVELGLAMRPDLTGKGNGLAFVQAGIAFAKKRFSPTAFTLDVATFNQRAMKVYERAGFTPGKTFWRNTRQGRQEFLVMTRDA
jgi:ribosomal-protein-alanine N-acetyltransferase